MEANLILHDASGTISVFTYRTTTESEPPPSRCGSDNRGGRIPICDSSPTIVVNLGGVFDSPAGAFCPVANELDRDGPAEVLKRVQ
jgi:hypothetical protein